MSAVTNKTKLSQLDTDLFAACETGDMGAVRDLLSSKAQVNVISPLGDTPLQRATVALYKGVEGARGVAETLLVRGASMKQLENWKPKL